MTGMYDVQLQIVTRDEWIDAGEWAPARVGLSRDDAVLAAAELEGKGERVRVVFSGSNDLWARCFEVRLQEGSYLDAVFYNQVEAVRRARGYGLRAGAQVRELWRTKAEAEEHRRVWAWKRGEADSESGSAGE